jgi:class 3 adenylate cyclase
VVSPDVAAELLKGDLRLGGETRQVTTLFADVRGFTTLTEHLSPERVIGMLNEWLELAATVIAEEGGIVDKYMGDSVMAVFGAPMADEAHALRAVRAAVRLRDVTAGVDRGRQQRGEAPFTIGIGVNTGAAVAGNMGSARRLNYTVLGASVNAANRLCSEAGSGEVLIGEATYQKVSAYVKATRLPPRISKGFSVAVTPYLVTGFVNEAAGDPA